MYDYSNCTSNGPKDLISPEVDDDAYGGWTNLNQTVNLNITDKGGSSLASVKYCIGNGCNVDEGIDLGEPYILNHTAEGENKITYAAWDNDGNKGENNYLIKIDKGNPITIDSYSGWQNSNFYITLSANDLISGINVVYWNLDDTMLIGSVNPPETPIHSKDILISGEGQHTLQYYSTDYADNQEETHIIYPSIDLTHPEVDVGEDKSSKKSVNINATASDNLSGIDNYLWQKISGPGDITFSNENGEDTTITASKKGTYTIRLTVTDNAENSNYDELEYVKEKKSSSGSSGGPVKVCQPNWECMEWTECTPEGKQTRNCSDSEVCRTNKNQPDLEQDCNYIHPKEPEPEPEPVIPELTIPYKNETNNHTNSTGGNGITGAVIGEIQGNPLGDFFDNLWNWLLGLF